MTGYDNQFMLPCVIRASRIMGCGHSNESKLIDVWSWIMKFSSSNMPDYLHLLSLGSVKLL